jgi:hypothetical protein
MNYLIILLAVVLLCAGWGMFQLWLSRHEPELAERANSCGNCSCKRNGSEPTRGKCHR